MKSNKNKVMALKGQYERKGSRLVGTDFDLIIQQRTPDKQSRAKSGSYLLAVSKPLGFRNYVSSLWETDTPGRYELEQGGVRYVLELASPRPHIYPKPGDPKTRAK